MAWVTSESSVGKPLSEVHAVPFDYPLISLEEGMKRAADVDVVFLCLPHAASIEPVRAFQATGVRVIDLSADFRLTDAQIYERGITPPTLPLTCLSNLSMVSAKSIASRLSGARLIANPGCYPTSVNLGLYPLAKAGWLSDKVIVDSKSGVSGAGRQSKQMYSYVEVNENFLPYNIGVRHRHIAEMEQVLNRVNGQHQHKFIFSPHLLPVNRGILSTMYVSVPEGVTEQMIRDLYSETYAGEPFIHLLPAGQLAPCATPAIPTASPSALRRPTRPSPMAQITSSWQRWIT